MRFFWEGLIIQTKINVATLWINGETCEMKYPGVHEDKIHLCEGEDYLENRVHASYSLEKNFYIFLDKPFQSRTDLIARRVPGNLKPWSKLQSDIHHSAEPESWKF